MKKNENTSIDEDLWKEKLSSWQLLGERDMEG